MKIGDVINYASVKRRGKTVTIEQKEGKIIDKRIVEQVLVEYKGKSIWVDVSRIGSEGK